MTPVLRAAFGALIAVASAACSQPPQEAAPRRPSPAAASPAGTPSPSPAPSTSPVPTPAVPPPSPSIRPVPPPAAPAPARAPARGTDVADPPPGTYTYALTGSRQSPLLLGSGQYPAGSTMVVEIADQVRAGPGIDYTQRTRVEADQTTATLRLRRSGGALAVLSSNLTITGIASYDCAYEPPAEIIRFPFEAGLLARQSWSNQQCSGSYEGTVVGPESVSAAGREWQAWKVVSRTVYNIPGSVEGTLDTTLWFSPELGTAVKSLATNNGKLTGQAFRTDQTSVLSAHPR